MLISEAFPSKYLKAADLKERPTRVQMASIQMEDVGDDEIKPVLYFTGKDRGLVVNKTNANNIALVYGDDTDGWMGNDLILYPTMTDFQGRSVACIRVKAPPVAAMARGAAPRADRAVGRPSIKATETMVDVDHHHVAGNGHARQEIDDEVPF